MGSQGCEAGLVHYRCRPWHGRRFRQGRPGRWTHGRGHRSGHRRRGQGCGKVEGLLIVKLDVTNRTDAEAAARAGRRPVRPHRRAGQQCRQLLLAGYFEELTPEQMTGSWDAPHRPDECHPRGPADHAQAPLRSHYLDLVGPPASSGLPSVRHMPRRSSASRAGWSRCSKRLRRSASPPRS